MQSSKEQQGEIRKPSSAISAKKQRKTIEWGKTRDLFKKTRDTKVTFHAKMDSIKDRNGMDLTEAGDFIGKGHQVDSSRVRESNRTGLL